MIYLWRKASWYKNDHIQIRTVVISAVWESVPLCFYVTIIFVKLGMFPYKRYYKTITRRLRFIQPRANFHFQSTPFADWLRNGQIGLSSRLYVRVSMSVRALQRCVEVSNCACSEREMANSRIVWGQKIYNRVYWEQFSAEHKQTAAYIHARNTQQRGEP